MTTDDMYFERGINLRHGFLAEFYVETPTSWSKCLRAEAGGVLLGPITVVEKGIAQAYEIQRRLRVWRPRRRPSWVPELSDCSPRSPAATWTGCDTFGRSPKPYLNADLFEAIGARFHFTPSCRSLTARKTLVRST